MNDIAIERKHLEAKRWHIPHSYVAKQTVA